MSITLQNWIRVTAEPRRRLKIEARKRDIEFNRLVIDRTREAPEHRERPKNRAGFHLVRSSTSAAQSMALDMIKAELENEREELRKSFSKLARKLLRKTRSHEGKGVP